MVGSGSTDAEAVVLSVSEEDLVSSLSPLFKEGLGVNTP